MRATRWLPVLLAAAPALAQTPTTQAQPCVVDIDSVGHAANFQKQANGQFHVFAGGGVLAHCRDQSTTMNADSFAWFADRGELRLLNRVHFSDSTGFLDADRVTYWVRQERLIAQSNVYTRNTRSRLDLRGPNLDYYRAVPPIRDTVELYATGRPTIHFYAQRDSAASDSARPFVIVADRVRMRGGDRMWGSGRVTIDRADLAARGDSAQLDLGRNRGFLVGDPELRDSTGGRYRLTGRRIAFDLTDAHDVRRVIAQGSAEAQGPDWRLRGDTLDIAVDSGTVQRAQAWGRACRANAVSGLNTIYADSLDIHMPAQVVRQVWAYGRGRATSKPDSTVTEDDWLTGDTLRADFALPDSAARRSSELEHITAFGSARAYYHTENGQDPHGERGINYSRGRRIDIVMRARKVRTVDVVGQVDGIYLEPVRPRPARSDTTRADTTVAPRARATPGATPLPRTP